MTVATVTVITVTVMTGTDTADGEKSYTIDELATLSRVPSRTIRFYQSEGALPKPVIKGRVAFYGTAHLERLSQITELQDRGLQIKAIRDVLSRTQKGEFSLQEWMGSLDQLSSPWATDRPKMMSEAELATELEGGRPGLLGELSRMGAVDRRGDTWFVASPALLSLALRLGRAGMPAPAIESAFRIISKQLGRLAEDLASYFIKNTDALGDEPARAYEELRPVSLEAVRVVFAHEMERTLRKATESGAIAAFTRGKRKKSKT